MNQMPSGLHGAYTYEEARRELGERRLREAVDNGELIGFGRGVLLEAHRALEVRTRAAGGLLLTGRVGVLVGPTAAMLHGCTATGGFPVHVLVPHWHRVRSRCGLVVRQGQIRGKDVVELEGLPVHRLEVTIGELLRSAPRRAALACADQALRMTAEDRRESFRAEVRRVLAEEPDRRGTRRASALLDLATGLPDSPAVSALRLVLADAALPPPECGYRIGARTVSFAWPDHGVALDYVTRAGPPPDRELTIRGWRVITARVGDLDEPTALSRTLRGLLLQSRAAA